MGAVKHVLAVDLETFSATDIAKCGSYKYMEDPEFEILLMAYAYDDADVVVLDFTAGDPIPAQVLKDLTDPGVTKTAFNCAFEREALRQHLGVYMPPEQWEDTMILAGQCGLPMSLKGASEALGLSEDEAKMKEGKALIKYFCLPCKPTKVNGGRTRNLPEHAPEKWVTFKHYNGMDVVAERAIRKRLIQWKPTETEHRFWCLDARINERGVRIDRQLARNAVAMSERYKAELTQRAIDITGIENPRSTAQIKQWLYDQEGKEFPSLNKKVIAEVVAGLQTDEAKEFMAIRSELSKSSTDKYAAMMRAMGQDDHVRGCFAFYGANRTGRFSSKIVQFQNLSKNAVEDLDNMRDLVRAGKYTLLKTLYDGVADSLSQLVRTAIVPEEGHKFMISDFSAIEARVIAWFADEEWRLDVFRNGGDIYCMSASQMFKVPVVKHGENGHLRQKGKVAELACIAEGQRVLTNVGLVPIEQVSTDMLVWDGENWVSHEGVVCNGYKEVITYDGLTATEDHLVWVTGKRDPVRLGDAAESGARLLRTGFGGSAVRVGGYNITGEALHKGVAPAVRTDKVHWLWKRKLDKLREPTERIIQRVSALFTAEESTEMVVQKTIIGEKQMREQKRPGVSAVRRPRNTLCVQQCKRSLCVLGRILRRAGQILGDRQDQYKRGLRVGKSKVCDAGSQSGKSQNNGAIGVQAGALALRRKHCAKIALLGNDAARNYRRREHSSVREKEKLANNKKQVAVYDIRNAGRHHRYTVSGVLVHNCGYGGGINALKTFGADKMGMTEEEMQETVDLWRESSPKITAMWRKVEKAAIRAIVKRGTVVLPEYKGLSFTYESGVLWMTLPSGRRLAYWDARYAESGKANGRKCISYMGVDQKTKRWGRIETWGGKMVENCVQATARDCLRDAMMALDADGYDIRCHVHDEVIVTEPVDSGRTVEDMSEVMGRPIEWAPGLPLRADGYEGTYYFKD